MTRKDYIAIADTIVELINSGTLDKNGNGVAVFHTFVGRLRADNPKFNEKIFNDYIAERI